MSSVDTSVGKKSSDGSVSLKNKVRYNMFLIVFNGIVYFVNVILYGEKNGLFLLVLFI